MHSTDRMRFHHSKISNQNSSVAATIQKDLKENKVKIKDSKVPQWQNIFRDLKVIPRKAPKII